MKKIAVIGGSAIDIKASSRNKFLTGTSNIGEVSLTCGGVAFNIARNLSLLDNKVFLITALGNDSNAQMIEKECSQTGITLSPVRSNMPTGIYSAITGHNGELIAAVSAMDIFQELNPDTLKNLLNQAETVDFIVCDTNIGEEALRFTARYATKNNIPILIEPTSIDKCHKMQNLSDKPDYISPNEEELYELAQMPPTATIAENTEKLFAQGYKNIILTLGRHGSMYINAEDSFSVEALPASPCDVTGAGDALVAAFINGILKNKTSKEALIEGTIAAYLTITDLQTVNSALSENMIKKYKEEFIDENSQITN